MPRQKSADRVEALRRQQAELAAKIKEAEAADRENRKEGDRKRGEVAGRVALALLAQEPEPEVARLFRVALDEQLKRPSERALFPGLPPLPVTEETAPKRGKAAQKEPAPAAAAPEPILDFSRARFLGRHSNGDNDAAG